MHSDFQLISLANMWVHVNTESTAGADRKQASAKRLLLISTSMNFQATKQNKEETFCNVPWCTVEGVNLGMIPAIRHTSCLGTLGFAVTKWRNGFCWGTLSEDELCEKCVFVIIADLFIYLFCFSGFSATVQPSLRDCFGPLLCCIHLVNSCLSASFQTWNSSRTNYMLLLLIVFCFVFFIEVLPYQCRPHDPKGPG